MNLLRCAYLGTGAVLSVLISTAIAVGIFKAAELRVLPPYVFDVWWFLGKYVAMVLVHVIPHAWIHGSPTSETYWPAATSAGFVILCAIVIWAVVVFVAGLVVRRLGRSP